MAPEIHLNMPYSGVAIDLFAAGITLFIMFVGTPPFYKANPKDNFYKFLCTNKHENFWNTHIRMKAKNQIFSDSFKNIINCMLAFDPTQRLSLSEIKAHPWYNGPTVNIADFKKEFLEKQLLVENKLKKEKMKKKINEKNDENKNNNQKFGFLLILFYFIFTYFVLIFTITYFLFIFQ